MSVPRAMVLCAGFGTRLRPLTDERPKPLLPIGDRTLLEHVLDRFERAGVLPVVVNAHHLSRFFKEFTDGWARISHVVDEVEIRGTAGGVAGARGLFAGGPVLVANGDLIVPISAALLEQVPPNGLCLGVAPRAVGQGSVGIGAGQRVVRLRGERFGEETTSGDYVGMMAIGAGVELPQAGCLIGDVALPLLRGGEPVLSEPCVSNAWSAPGDSVENYLDENLSWLRARFAAAGTAEQGSFVAAEAVVAPAVTLVSSVIGAGAEVSGRGLVERCVVWPGARAQAPLADCVVTTAGRVVARRAA
jgi:mannose-1-phosphate guanylyltransferase